MERVEAIAADGALIKIIIRARREGKTAEMRELTKSAIERGLVIYISPSPPIDATEVSTGTEFAS